MWLGISVAQTGVTPISEASCTQSAAAFHKVNPIILQAIIFHETGGRPDLVLKNSNGSFDMGIAGINSVHLSELNLFGIQKDQLLDGCVNTYIAAWLLAKQIRLFGNTWIAVGSYHSKTPIYRDAYARKIMTILRNWGIDI